MLALNIIKSTQEDMIASILPCYAKNSPMATRQPRILLKLKHARRN